jgi:hypothetical protein
MHEWTVVQSTQGAEPLARCMIECCRSESCKSARGSQSAYQRCCLSDTRAALQLRLEVQEPNSGSRNSLIVISVIVS